MGPASTPSICQDKGKHALNPWTKCERHPESTGVSPLRSGFQWAGGLSTRSWRWITGFLETRGQRVKNITSHVGQAHANQASFQHYSGPESAEPALIDHIIYEKKFISSFPVSILFSSFSSHITLPGTAFVFKQRDEINKPSVYSIS